MNIEDILNKVPDYKTFYTVKEMNSQITRLEEKYPQAIQAFDAGYSRGGNLIRLMKIGRGKKHALCFACPHPNEPIGIMTILTLAEILAKDSDLTDELDFTWYFIPCIDPDGTILNEAWFKGPFSLRNYVLNFYRPPGYKQVEWTFPIDVPGWHFDSPIPETQILMKLMNDLKPELLVSLHNSAYGGAFWYLTKGDPTLCNALENAAKRQGVPLHLGEPEAEYMGKHSDAVFTMMSIRSYVEHMADTIGIDEDFEAISGGCSADYIETVCDCQTIIAELPYFYDPRIADNSESDMTRSQVLLRNAEFEKESYSRLNGIWDRVLPHFTDGNPFYEFVQTCIDAYNISPEAKFDAAKSDQNQRRATVSEVFDNLYGARLFEALNFGLGARACGYELDQPGASERPDHELLKECLGEFLDNAERLCAMIEANAEAEVIPIKKLVSVQMESALMAARSIDGDL